MCRAKSSGGRRCKCTGEALAAHNARRRKNRAIKQNVLKWAEDHDLHPGIVDQLRQHPPIAAKRWAEAQGMDPEEFAGDDPRPRTPTHARPGVVVDGEVVRRPPRYPGPEDENADDKPASLSAGAQLIPGGTDSPGMTATPPLPSLQRSGSSRAGDGAGTGSGAWWDEPEVRASLEELRRTQGTVEAEQNLLGPVAGSSWASEQGTNETHEVTLADGRRGFFKPFEGLDMGTANDYGQDQALQPIHEAAAWRLAQRLGHPYDELVPPCVVREIEGQAGSLSSARPGFPGASDAQWESSPWWQEAALFDALIGQQDRHRFNLLYEPGETVGGGVSLIDHGFAFAHADDQLNASVFVDRRVDSEPELTTAEQILLQRVLDSPDTLGLRGVLEDSRLDALRSRAARMLREDRILDAGDF